MLGLIGKKVGMTQIYDAEGSMVPVTVVHIRANTVMALSTKDKHGYNSVHLGHEEVKKGRVNKVRAGVAKKNNLPVAGHIKEFRTERVGEIAVGSKISVAAFAVGDQVDVTGVSKGKGFQGVMKRHHFGGGHDSHGCSISHRSAGSIGNRTWPGRVIPGKKMAGQMGNQGTTIQNLTVVGVEPEQELVLIKGALPGGKGMRIYVYPQASDFEERVVKMVKPVSVASEAVAAAV